MKFIFMKGVPGISSRVEKNLMIHSLRESSVMHILEESIDLRYTQLISYKSSKKTEIYTHISNKNLREIRTPVDFMSEDSDKNK